MPTQTIAQQRISTPETILPATNGTVLPDGVTIVEIEITATVWPTGPTYPACTLIFESSRGGNVWQEMTRQTFTVGLHPFTGAAPRVSIDLTNFGKRVRARLHPGTRLRHRVPH